MKKFSLFVVAVVLWTTLLPAHGQAPRPPNDKLSLLTGDVALSSPTDGQPLVFNLSTGFWNNSSALTDISIHSSSLSATVANFANATLLGPAGTAIDWSNAAGTQFPLPIIDNSANPSLAPTARQLISSDGLTVLLQWDMGALRIPFTTTDGYVVTSGGNGTIGVSTTLPGVPTISSTTDLLEGDGSGNAIDAGLTPDDIRSSVALRTFAALGSVMKALPPTLQFSSITASISLSSGTVYFVPVYLPGAATITGVKFYMATQGSFTADTSNVVALYTYSAGTLTRVAISTDDPNLWKATSNTWSSKAFNATYAATSGLYFIGLLYHSSAQTTAPALGGSTALNVVVQVADFTNFARLYSSVSGQTTCPSSQAMSGTSGQTNQSWLALY